MELTSIFEHLDNLFAQEKLDEAESYLSQMCAQAERDGDIDACIGLYNELIGLYRVSGKDASCFAAAEKALTLLKAAGLTDSVHYATALLNYATARTVFGYLNEALSLYQQAEAIYAARLQPDDARLASLYNNLSLLWIKRGDPEQSLCQLEKSLAILLKQENTQSEIATCYTNMALCHLRGDRQGQAEDCLDQAEAIFLALPYYDTHFDNMLAVLGQLRYQQSRYAESADCFQRALDHVGKVFGHGQNYVLLCRNCAAAWAAAGEQDKSAWYQSLADEAEREGS